MKKRVIKLIMSAVLIASVVTGISASAKATGVSSTGDSVEGTTVLLMHMDGDNGSTTFKDETGKNVIFAGSPKISTDQSKFGGASAYFDSSNSSVLRVQKSSDFEFGTGDFTVDLWYFPTNEKRNALLYMGATNFSIDYNYQGTRNVNIWAGNDGKTWNLISSDPGGNGIGHKSLNLNQWNHIAVTRQGNIWRTFINGVKDTEITVAGELTCTPHTDYATVIGAMGEQGEYYKVQGYIDELRMVKGKAEYTTDFTPPTSPYSYSSKSNNLKLVLEANKSKQLSVTDELSDNGDMTWTSSDESIATVDANGLVKTLKPGNTVITCKSKDGTYTETINILVVDLNYQLAVNVTVGDNCRLTVDDLANTANVTWKADNTNIATVTNTGKVTAVSEGLTYVTATDSNGKEVGRIFIRVSQK